MNSISFNNFAHASLNFVQNNLIEAVQLTLRQRIAIVALAVITSLAFLFLVFACYISCEDSHIYSYAPPYTYAAPDLDHFIKEQDIHAVLPEEETSEPDAAAPKLTLEEEVKQIKSMKKNWLDDHEKETKRLVEASILPNFANSNLHYHLNGIFNNNQALRVIGEVLELKKFYGKTHYVFTHGQAPMTAVANHLTNEFMRKFTPLLYHTLKIPFRVPHTVDYTANVDEFIQKHNANTSLFQDNLNNALVMSVDGDIWSIASAESALYFFATACNIVVKDPTAIFQKIIFNYLPDETISTMLAERASKIAKERAAETTVGTLYAICIPKEIVQDPKRTFVYRAHPFGVKCDCYSESENIKILEQMQANKPVFCKGSYNGFKPQYRIITARLTEEKDVRSFAVNALPKAKRKLYREQIKELVKEATLYSQLLGLIETLEEDDPSAIVLISSFIEANPQINPAYVQHLFSEKGILYTGRETT